MQFCILYCIFRHGSRGGGDPSLITRREIIKSGGLFVAIGATGYLFFRSASNALNIRDREHSALVGRALQQEALALNAETEELGYEEEISLLIQGQGLINSTGVAYYKAFGNTEQYQQMFIPDQIVTGNSPDYDHHIPSFWTAIFDADEPGTTLQNNLINLANRVTQHSVHFSGKSLEQRNYWQNRLVQLPIHQDIPDLNNNAQFLIKKEEAQLRRDIGMYYAAVQKEIGANAKDYAQAAIKYQIDGWVNDYADVLSFGPTTTERIATSAYNSNPFAIK